MSKVVVVGQGYVGLPLAVLAAEAGHVVVGYDVDEYRMARLAGGESVVEDVSDDRLEAVTADCSYLPTSRAQHLEFFDVAVICVPTPLRDGRPDLSYIDAAATVVGKYLTPGALVILESTTYPGTTTERLVPLLEEVSGLSVPMFHVGMSPERIDPGNPSFGLANTPKVVSGVNEVSLTKVTEFYEGFVDRVVPVSSCEVAELAKLIENTYRYVNVGLVNELAVLARGLGIDVWEALDAAASKPFGFARFTPGPGVGGHCLPVDPLYLSWQTERRLGRPFRFAELAAEVNQAMPAYVAERVMLALNERNRCVNGANVLLVGLAYKPGTADMRESPGLAVAERLHKLGARVAAYDTFVDWSFVDATIGRVDDLAVGLEAADAVVVVTDHPDVDWSLVERYAGRAYVLDCRHRLAGKVDYL